MKKTLLLSMVFVLAFASQVQAKTGSVTQDLNKDWLKYTNYDWNFSVDLPKNVDIQSLVNPEGGGAGCKIDSAPLAIFKKSSNEYLVENKYYLDSKCKLVSQTTKFVVDKQKSPDSDIWRINVAKAGSDKDIESFLKKYYTKEGYTTSCNWSKEITAKDPVTRIMINGDGKDLFTTKCSLSWSAPDIIYYPQKKIIASFYSGSRQAIDYSNPNNRQDYYDLQIMSSFQFNIPGWTTYKNSKYGFTIKFPASWKGYKVSTTKLTNGTATINFGFSSQSSILTIRVYTKDQFLKNQTGIEIAENYKYVFTYGGMDIKTNNSTMKSRAQEVQSIINTFVSH